MNKFLHLQCAFMYNNRWWMDEMDGWMIKLAFLALYAKRRVRIREKGVGDKSSALRFLLRPGVTSSKQTSSWSKRASPPSPPSGNMDDIQRNRSFKNIFLGGEPIYACLELARNLPAMHAFIDCLVFWWMSSALACSCFCLFQQQLAELVPHL